MSKKDKKKRPVVVVEGAPEWMVTFGDLMSLLLTFFVLLFSVSEVKDEKIYDVIKSIKTHWEIEAPTAGFTVESISEIVELLADQNRMSPESTEEGKGKSEEAVDHPFGTQAAVTRIDDDLRLEIAGRVIFAEGSAELLPESRSMLAMIRGQLMGWPTRVRVVGHTSPRALPATSTFEDHDELAYRRARAVGAVLTGEEEGTRGVRETRLEYASRGHRDLLPEVDIFDAADRARLDRVEIIITPEKAIKN